MLKYRSLLKNSFPSLSLKVNVSDNDILEKMSNCLGRPAFITPFRFENSFGDFRKAIDDTIEAINTGIYRLRDGILIENIYPKSKIADIKIREKIDDIILDLMKLRRTYDNLKRQGEIESCKCGYIECPVSIWRINVCVKMDDSEKEYY